MKRELSFFLLAAAIARAEIPSAVSRGDASSVIRSTEGVKTVITSKSARVLRKGDSVEFTGDVQLTRGHDFMSADRLVTEDNNNVARAWGKVFFRRDGPGEPICWEAWGDRSVYNSAASSGTLWGESQPAHARRTPREENDLPGGVVDMFASEITLTRVEKSSGTSDLSAGIVKGRGGVYLKSMGGASPVRVTELWADRSDFDGPSDRFRLEGAFAATGAFVSQSTFTGLPPEGGAPPRPFGRQTQGRDVRELSGEVIDLHPSERRLVVQRSVQAHVLFEQQPGQQQKKNISKEKKSSVPSR